MNFVLLLLPILARPHANMKTPTPRNGMAIGVGKKLSGVLDFQDSCGGTAAGDPGIGASVASYVEGSQVTVSWDTTIAHLSSPGVRFAIAYGSSTSFSSSILASNLEAGAVGIHSSVITIPTGQTGEAVLQFSWVSSADGGSYIGCSDVTITAADNGGGTDNNDNGDSDNSNDSSNNDTPTSDKIESEGMSGGSIFFILLCVGSVIYTGGGFAYNYRKNETIGHPHHEQWKKFGGQLVSNSKAVKDEVKKRYDEHKQKQQLPEEGLQHADVVMEIGGPSGIPPAKPDKPSKPSRTTAV
ncbi:hypothetical protein ScalyP_jg1628 [Parmales sp. scaly parma]|nr:hypothetical protein ScalyP_jg1628 [Parmales sp. scaly parma]